MTINFDNWSRRVRYDTPTRRARIREILEALKPKALTVKQLSAKVGLSESNLRGYLGHLHGDGGGPKQVFIQSWERGEILGKNPTARWRTGTEADRAYPGRRTQQEYYKRWKKKLLLDADRWMHFRKMVAIRNGRRATRQGRGKADPFVALFFNYKPTRKDKHDV